MIHQIVLELVMNTQASDFLNHGEEASKCSWYLVINIRTKTLLVPWFIVMHWMICSPSIIVL
jgi:hypothetical protein